MREAHSPVANKVKRLAICYKKKKKTRNVNRVSKREFVFLRLFLYAQ